MKKNWKILSPSRRLSVTERLLANRQINKESSPFFLDPPFPLLDLMKSLLNFDETLLTSFSELVRGKIKSDVPIFVHGDYDVDGIASTAIFWKVLYHDLGYKKVVPFLPDRFEQGYGLSRESIDRIYQLSQDRYGSFTEGSLLITLDCGITSKDEVEYAKAKGFEVIIVDHHSRPELLPEALIIWSDRLCAAGLSYFLASLLLGRGAEGYLDLAAIGTVADLQPLLGLNRSLVRHGLTILNQTENLGLRQLIKAASLEGKRITPFEVGWVLAPRLNAAGRMENALNSLRLLCTKNVQRAGEIARQLNEINKERRRVTEEAFQDAREKVLAGNGNFFINLVHSESYHEGVIGLVAGKLAQTFLRPAIVISQGKEFSKGSARSVKGLDIISYLGNLRFLFEGVGGHPMAAGFTIRTERIEELSKFVSQPTPEDPTREILVETELFSDDLSENILEDIAAFEPFGSGNEEPLFLLRGVAIGSLRTVGKGAEHLKMSLKIGGKVFPAIAFGQGEKITQLKSSDFLDVLAYLQTDQYSSGPTKLSFKLKDFDASST